MQHLVQLSHPWDTSRKREKSISAKESKHSESDVQVKRLNPSPVQSFSIPVFKKPGFFPIQFGMAIAENMEKPKTKIFLEEFMSMACRMRCEISKLEYRIIDLQNNEIIPLFTCRLEIPAAVMTPNMIRNIPPITGSGMVVKIAPNLPSIPNKIITTPLRRITVRLPTCWHSSRVLAQDDASKKKKTYLCFQVILF